QREVFAAFVPKSPSIFGPHGAGGVAVPRCALWPANPRAKPMTRTPTTIPDRPKRVSTNWFFMCLLVNALARCVDRITQAVAAVKSRCHHQCLVEIPSLG